MNKEKITKIIKGAKTFVKSTKGKLAIVGIIGIVVGFNLGGATAEQLSAVEQLPNLQSQVTRLENIKDELETENEDLQAKVDQAKPYFEMEESKRQEEIAKAKEKEEKRLETEKKKEEETKRKELEAKTKTLSNGNFVAGEDFEPGTYNIIAVKGGGNVSSSNIFNGGINAIMGVQNDGFHEKEYKNIQLPEGTTLKVSRVTIKLVPRG